MTDAEIMAIRDEHLPSQGEPFDCLAFARAILQYGRTEQDAIDDLRDQLEE